MTQRAAVAAVGMGSGWTRIADRLREPRSSVHGAHDRTPSGDGHPGSAGSQALAFVKAVHGGKSAGGRDRRSHGSGVGRMGESLSRKLAGSQVPRLDWTAFEGPVWLFAIGITLVAGVLFGLPACWQVMRPRTSLAAGAGPSPARVAPQLGADGGRSGHGASGSLGSSPADPELRGAAR